MKPYAMKPITYESYLDTPGLAVGLLEHARRERSRAIGEFVTQLFRRLAWRLEHVRARRAGVASWG